MLLLSRNSGASLIEVLVSAIILSVGLLGMAGLQVEGLKKRKESELKSLAALEANDIVDRMRANIIAADNKNYDMTQTTPEIHDGCLGGVQNGALGFNPDTKTVTGSQQFTPSSCSSEQMAQTDLQEWIERLNQTLPSGNGFVCVTNNPGTVGTALNCNGNGDFYVINVNWTNQQGDSHEFRMSFKP
jgi:type IV pilus assembly protein PilV